MNAIETVTDRLRKEFPDGKFEIDPGIKSNSIWFLDCLVESQFLTVEWRPQEGFGICFDREISFSGPDKIILNNNDTFECVKKFLKGES